MILLKHVLRFVSHDRLMRALPSFSYYVLLCFYKSFRPDWQFVRDAHILAVNRISER